MQLCTILLHYMMQIKYLLDDESGKFYNKVISVLYVRKLHVIMQMMTEYVVITTTEYLHTLAKV